MRVGSLETSNKKEKNVKVLVVGQTPPPFHGQSMMIQMLIDGPVAGVDIHHVRMAFSDSMNEVGRFQISKVVHLFSLIVRIVSMRFWSGASILYYPPAGPNRVPLIRDIVLLLCTRWMFRKTIFHFHAGGVSELIPTLPGWFQFLLRKALFYPNAAIQLSPLTVPDAAFIKAKRVFMVPNGVDDPIAANPILQSKVINNRCTNLLYLGTVCESKGILVLLAACRQLQDRTEEFHLHVVGSFQPASFENIVRHRISESNLERHVTLHGQRTGDEKNQLFAQADVFCFPTHYESEGFPCVLVEAMSFSLPVVTTNWRGIPSIVEDGDTGYLIDVKDSDGLAQKIVLLARNDELRMAMGKRARARYESEFTRSKHLEHMSRVFLEVARSQATESLRA